MYRFFRGLTRPTRTGEPSPFEVAVAVTMAVILGIVTFVLVGMPVFAVALWTLPGLVPVLLGAGALTGVLLIVRGGRSAKAFGAGLILGWALMAVWTSAGSLGL